VCAQAALCGVREPVVNETLLSLTAVDTDDDEY
jgi:hypothetical protein